MLKRLGNCELSIAKINQQERIPPIFFVFYCSIFGIVRRRRIVFSFEMEYIKRAFFFIGVFAMRPFFFVSLLTVLTAFSVRADGLKAKTDIALTDSVSFNYSFVEKPKVLRAGWF